MLIRKIILAFGCNSNCRKKKSCILPTFDGAFYIFLKFMGVFNFVHITASIERLNFSHSLQYIHDPLSHLQVLHPNLF